MEPKLFACTEPTWDGPAEYTEPDFAYLDRSSRFEARRIRDLLESWFSHYPDTEKEQFKRRFQSSQFTSAFFELYVYELLIRLGCSLEIHPNLPSNTKKHPEFLVRDPSGEEFYLEATLAKKSDLETAVAARLSTFYDTINRLVLRDFYVTIQVRGLPDRPLPGRRIRESLRRKCATLNPDEVADLPTFDLDELLGPNQFQHNGWNILFSLVRKSAETPTKLARAGANWDRSVDAIRKAAKEKGRRYGKLAKPYVIAINVLTAYPDPQDVIVALEEINYTRVSALLIAFSVYPSRIATADLWLFHNLRAERQCIGQITRLSNWTSAQGFKEGICPQEIFGLDGWWPEER
jgi:hypothetical protein